MFNSNPRFFSHSSNCSALGAPDNRGTTFIIGFMENYIMSSPPYQCELFITTARTTVVTVKVDSPKCTSPKISASFSITAGQVKQLMLDYRIRVTGSAKESKGMFIGLFVACCINSLSSVHDWKNLNFRFVLFSASAYWFFFRCNV